VELKEFRVKQKSYLYTVDEGFPIHLSGERRKPVL
jgi:hypothetical protein